jgi:hypothetical protein
MIKNKLNKGTDSLLLCSNFQRKDSSMQGQADCNARALNCGPSKLIIMIFSLNTKEPGQIYARIK